MKTKQIVIGSNPSSVPIGKSALILAAPISAIGINIMRNTPVPASDIGLLAKMNHAHVMNAILRRDQNQSRCSSQFRMR